MASVQIREVSTQLTAAPFWVQAFWNCLTCLLWFPCGRQQVSKANSYHPVYYIDMYYNLHSDTFAVTYVILCKFQILLPLKCDFESKVTAPFANASLPIQYYLPAEKTSYSQNYSQCRSFLDSQSNTCAVLLGPASFPALFKSIENSFIANALFMMRTHWLSLDIFRIIIK